MAKLDSLMSGQAGVGAGAYCPFPGTGISPPFMIRGSPVPCITIFFLVFGAVFDKNSLWGELNIQKGELCVKGILAQDLGFVCGPFQGELGRILGVEARLSTIGRGSIGSFDPHPGTPVPSAPYSPSFITAEGKHPRGSRGHDKGDRRGSMGSGLGI